MSDFNPYTYYIDSMYLNELMQPFSVSFNALKHLFEFMNISPSARYALANGWEEFRFPLISLEVILMGRDIVEEDNN